MEGEKLLALIEKATNSTSKEVDPRLLKAIKSTVRSSDDNIRIAIDSLMQKMKKDHSQVRYLTLLIIDELFMRSKLDLVRLVYTPNKSSSRLRHGKTMVIERPPLKTS